LCPPPWLSPLSPAPATDHCPPATALTVSPHTSRASHPGTHPVRTPRSSWTRVLFPSTGPRHRVQNNGTRPESVSAPPEAHRGQGPLRALLIRRHCQSHPERLS